MEEENAFGGDSMKIYGTKLVKKLSRIAVAHKDKLLELYTRILSLSKRPLTIVFVSLISLIIAMVSYLIPHPLVMIILALSPIALVFILKQPFFICLIFILFSFFRLHEAFPMLMPFKIPLLMALGSLAALLWHLVITREIKPFLTQELIWFLVFLGLVTLGLIFSSNRSLAVSAFTGNYIKIAIMVFAIAWLIRTERQFSITGSMIIICGIAVGLVALNNKFNGIGLVEGTRVTIGRDISSILGDPNDLALVLSFPISFAMGVALTKGLNIWSRCLGLMGYFLIAAAIIATQSRGGLLAIVAVSSIFAFYKIRSKFLIVCLGSIGILVLAVFAGISERSSGGASETGVDESAQGRLYAWQAAIRMANSHPFSGVGLDNFTVNYFYYSSHWDGMNHAVHSTWFGVLAETGYVGLGVFLVLVYKVVSSMYRTVNKLKPLYSQGKCSAVLFCSAQSILAGLAGFIASGTFLTQGFTWPLYILLALSIAVQQQTKKLM